MPINYFLASIVSYLGLLVGIILIKIAPEEQKPGKKYFILFKKILFLLIIGFLLFYNANFLLSILILIFILILMSTNKLKLDKPSLIYFLLGIIFFLSYNITDLFVIESILIFLYGLPAASLLFKKNNYKEILLRNLTFFLPIVVLYLL